MDKKRKSLLDFISWFSDGYKRLNIFLAKQNLDVSKNKYVPVVVAGTSEFFEQITKLGAFFALALTVTGFISLSITPAGWALLSGGFVLGAIGLAFYKIYNVIHDLDKLSDQQDKITSLENKLTRINGLLSQYRLKKAAKQALAKELGIDVGKLEKHHELDIDKLLTGAPGDNAAQKHEKLSDKIDGILLKSLNTLLGIGVLVAKKIHVYNTIAKLVGLVKSAVDSVKKLYNNCSPLVKKILEFSSIAGLTLTTIGGGLIASSHILGINMASLGIISAFGAVTGLTGGLAIGVFAMVAFTVAAIFVVNKIFFADPVNQFASDTKKTVANLEKEIDEAAKEIRLARVDIALLSLKIKAVRVHQDCDSSRKLEEEAVRTPLLSSGGYAGSASADTDAVSVTSLSDGYTPPSLQ